MDSVVDGRLVAVPASVEDVLLAVFCSSEVDAKIVADDDSVVNLPVDEASVVLLSGISVALAVLDADLVDGADTENKIVFRREATAVLLEWLASVDVPAEFGVSVDSVVDGRLVAVPASVDDVLLPVVCSFEVDSNIVAVGV